MATPSGLLRLHNAAALAASRFGVAASEAFAPCGLGLFGAGEAYAYWCTPTNVFTFAATGGDGVHYSHLLQQAHEAVCPVVMTVPMADSSPGECNLVVAESFEEFFNIGYYVGWFSLEQLVYERAWALSYFGAPDPDQDGWCTPRLEFAREQLSMVPSPPTERRLAELTAKYSSQLKYMAQSAA